MTTTTMDYLANKWEQLKGSIKETWGKITNDDLLLIEGKKQRLINLLVEKYEYSADEAERRVNEFLAQHDAKHKEFEQP